MENAEKLINKKKSEKEVLIRNYLKQAYKLYNNNPQKTKNLALKAIELSRQISDRNLLGESIRMLGVFYYISGDYEKAHKKYLITLEIFKKMKNKRGIANVLNNLSNVQKVKGLYDKALEYQFENLKIRKELDDKTGLIVTFNAIGLIYWNMKEFKRALEFYQKGLSLAKETKVDSLIAKISNNIGIIYRNQQKFEKALKYYFTALKIKKQNNKHLPLANTYQNIGVIYIEKQDYDKAYENTEKALVLMDKIGNENGVARAKLNLGYINIALSNFKQAQKDLKIALQIIKKIGAKQLEMICYDYLAMLYEKMQDYKKAYDYYRKFHILDKEIYNEKKDKRIQTLTKKFEKEKQEFEKKVYILENIKLKKSNAAKDKFFSIIAHDLKSPFSSIISFVKIIKNSINKLDKEQILKFVEELEQSTNNTFHLLKNLLDWSRMQSGGIEFQPQNINVTKVIRGILQVKQPKARVKNIELRTELKENVIAYGDYNMITTIIRNLLNNAIKFTYPGGWVKISTGSQKKKIFVSIEDNGMGIKKEDIPKLFKIESNFSHYGTANEKGTGLGLILVNEFIKKNKGSIEVSSKPDEGSNFTFYLPGEKTE